MFKLNRTTEYGLISLRYIHQRSKSDTAPTVSAREIADLFGLPFEILAKTLQRLKEVGLIQSTQGAKGGYTIGEKSYSSTMAEYIEWMEGASHLVPCADTYTDQYGTIAPSDGLCDFQSKCDIKPHLLELNNEFLTFLKSIPLNRFLNSTNNPSPFSKINQPLKGSISNNDATI